MSEKVYTEAQMKAAIKSAFESGKDWATCYISWFTPSKEDHNKHRGQAIRKAMKAAEQCVHPTRLAVGTDGESDESAGG